MLNVMFSGRKYPQQELEVFYHEFQVKHVALMRQANCERFLASYTQNKTVRAIQFVDLIVPRDEQVDSQACLSFADENMFHSFLTDPDYNKIVIPHQFTDPRHMTFDLCQEQTIKPKGDRPSSIKVIYYLKPKDGVLSEDFFKKYSELLASSDKELILGNKRSYGLPLLPKDFANTSLKDATIGQYALIDELWFDSLADVDKFHKHLDVTLRHDVVHELDERSFSLVASDKVVFGLRS